MTPLPDDLSKWPDDSHELLGVERGADEITLKRAYLALVKRYKPEQHPEAFRKIREAYEQCRMWIGWRDMPFVISSNEATATDVEPAAKVPLDDGHDDDEVEPAVVERPVAKKAPAEPDIWDDALDGDRAAVYEVLKAKHRAEPTADLARKLYWLLMVNPFLDKETSRLDWLAAAMTADPNDFGQIELYRRELQADPELIWVEDFQTVMDRDDLLPGPRYQLTSLRIVAAIAAGEWHKAPAELIRYRKLVPLDDDQYLSLLATCRVALVGRRNMEFEDWLTEERRTVEHLALKQPYQFDRMDLADSLTVGFRDPKYADALDLAIAMWAGVETVTPIVVEHCLKPYTGLLPEIILERIDRLVLGRDFVGPFVAQQLHYNLGSHDDTEFSEDLVRGLVSAVALHGDLPWKSLRTKLINPLSWAGLSWWDASRACEDHPSAEVRKYADEIRSDYKFQIANAIARHLAV
jgi:hypothetical protein